MINSAGWTFRGFPKALGFMPYVANLKEKRIFLVALYKPYQDIAYYPLSSLFHLIKLFKRRKRKKKFLVTAISPSLLIPSSPLRHEIKFWSKGVFKVRRCCRVSANCFQFRWLWQMKKASFLICPKSASFCNIAIRKTYLYMNILLLFSNCLG